jgi:hypothetical protein
MLRWVAVLLIAMATAAGCSSSTGPSDDHAVTFPLAEGNTWEYSSRYLELGFPWWPDSVPDTVSITYRLEVARRETLLDTLSCFRLAQTALQESVDARSFPVYYVNREDGLYMVAYKPPGVFAGLGVWVDQKPAAAPHAVFRSYPLDRILAAIAQSEQGTHAPLPPDSLVFEDPPLRSLAYPLSVGVQWTYREPGSPWAVDKRVVGQSLVRVPGGVYCCYVVQWLIDIFDEDGEWDDDIELFDYVWRGELIKRSYTLRDVVLLGDDAQPADTLDVWEEISLTGRDVE